MAGPGNIIVPVGGPGLSTALAGGDSGALETLLDFSFLDLTAHNFKSVSSTTVDGVTFSLTNGSQAGACNFVAETGPGNGDGYFNMTQSSTTGDFFGSTATAAYFKMTGFTAKPGDRLYVVMTGILPSLTANAANPSINFFFENVSSNSRLSWRFAQPAAGDMNVGLWLFPSTTLWDTNDNLAQPINSPLSLGYNLPWGGVLSGTDAVASGTRPDDAWDAEAEGIPLEFGFAMRRGDAAVAVPSITLTGISIYRDARSYPV